MTKTLEQLLEENKALDTAEETKPEEIQEEVKPEEEIQEEIKPEEQIETPEEVIDEEKKEEKSEEVQEPGKKSFIDLINGKKDEPKEEEAPKAAELTEDIKAKLDRLAEIESNPLHKAISLGATKEELKKIAAEIAATDFSKMTYEQLLSIEVAKETGLEGEALEEEVSLLMAEHESKSAYQKVQAEKALKAQFESSAIESPTLKSLEEAYQAMPDPKLQAAKIAELKEQTILSEKREIAEFGKGLIGSELNGVEFTESELNKIIEEEYDIDAVAPYVNKDNKIEVGKFIYDKFRLRNFEKMVEAEVAKRVKQSNRETVVTKKVANGTSPATGTVDPKKEVAKGLGLPDYVVDKMKF
jgi:hypothetical protein